MNRFLGGVEVVHWNPRRNRLPLLRRFRVGSRVNNFGDLLGPIVATALYERSGLSSQTPSPNARLLTIGSILHFAQDGDTVWGSGVNGKIPVDQHPATTLDVRAVRGPLTRSWLQKNRQIDTPELFGDPALLLPELMPELKEWARVKTRSLSIIPNMHDARTLRGEPHVVDPRGPVIDILRQIAQSESVVGSSLHGVIVAESLEIPAVAVRSSVEPWFKYDDYARGTGRAGLPFSENINDATRAVRLLKPPQLDWQPQELIAAFPRDLWTGDQSAKSPS